MSVPRLGEECPNFELPESDGALVSKASLLGRPFVLYFYPKDNTSGCTLEAIEFTALAEDFSRAETRVFGVSPDPVASHCKFRDRHALRIKLLSDEHRSLIDAFGVWIEKSMYGRRYMGVERTTALIDRDGRIVRIWENVKAKGHAQEVLSAAQTLRGSDA